VFKSSSEASIAFAASSSGKSLDALMDVDIKWGELSGELETIRDLEELVKTNFHDTMLDLDTTFADREHTRDEFVRAC